MYTRARLASQASPACEETEAPDEEHEAFFVYAVLYRCPEVMLASASTSHGYMIVDTACQRSCHGQGWMEQHLELLKAKGQTWLPQYRSCEKTDWFQFGAGGPVKATGITRLPCATDGKHYLIDSCELTAGIPMLGSLKLLKALGTVLDLQAETAYLSKLQVTVPLRRLENGHLALSLLDSEEDFPETDSWEVVSKELVLPPFARRQEKNRQKVLTFRLDQGEEAEALSTETPDLELQYNFNTDLCRRLGSSGQAQLGEGVPWKVWNNTQEDGARRASASVAAQQVLLLQIPRLVRQGLRALRLAPSLASVVLPYLALAATGRRTRGAPLADQVPAVLPPASRCTHKNVKRSGNHGKYAVCQNPACGLKLRYQV